MASLTCVHYTYDLLQLSKKGSHDVGPWTLLQGNMINNYKKAEVQQWLKNITLAWVCLGGLEAFLSFVTDHFHQQPVARQSTNPSSKCQNVDNLVTRLWTLQMCNLFICCCFQNIWGSTSGWPGVAQGPRCGLEACRGNSSFSVILHSVLMHSDCLWCKSTFSKSKVVAAYNGKSVEVEDEGGDRQTIAVKDEQADLPPLR